MVIISKNVELLLPILQQKFKLVKHLMVFVTQASLSELEIQYKQRQVSKQMHNTTQTVDRHAIMMSYLLTWYMYQLSYKQ